MSFVLDTNICSAYLRADRRVEAKFLQYTGGLYISAMTLGELYAGACRSGQPAKRLDGIAEMLHEINAVIPIDQALAERYGRVRAELTDRGLVVANADLLIASTALHLNYTMVSHNVRHFQVIPGLRLEDRLVP